VGQITQRSASLSTYFTFVLKLDNKRVVYSTSAFARKHNHSLKPHLTWLTHREKMVLPSSQNKAPFLTIIVSPSPRPTLHHQTYMVRILRTPQLHHASLCFCVSSPSPPLLSRPLSIHHRAERARAAPPTLKGLLHLSPLSLSLLYFTLRSHFYVYAIATPRLASSFSLLPSRSSLPSSSTALAFHIRTS
jgi:hypothetical protein